MAAPSRSFLVIVAATAGSLGIGKNGTLPWRLAGDMAYFKRITSTPDTPGKVNAVIMGRRTWQSIPERFRPLQGRRNVVLSRNPCAKEELLLPDDVLHAGSLSEALTLLARPPHAAEVDKVFVIGGGSVYAEAVASNLCEKVLLTSVRVGDGRFDDCDVHFPALASTAFKLVTVGPVQEENGVEYSFDEYDHIGHSNQYGGGGGGGGSGNSDKVGEGGVASASGAPQSGRLEDDKENSPGAPQEAVVAGTGNEDTNHAVVGAKRKVEDAAGVGGRIVAVQEAGEGSSASVTSPTAAATAVGRAEEEEGVQGEGNEEEMQYLTLVEDILENGVRRGDRTGTGTLSKFGVQMRFSLREERFPLLTTKRVFWRGVAEELLWFIAGCTNANVLKERGIHIWDGNGSREFLDG